MRKGPINTIPHRLHRCGFRPTRNWNDNIYLHVNGDKLSRKDGTYGIGWYLTNVNGDSIHYSGLKKSIVEWIENSGRYGRNF